MAVKKTTPDSPKPELAGWIGVMRVAVLIKRRYQKARDMMLEEKFGKVYYDGKQMMVREEAVRKYLKAQEATRG